MSVDMTQIDNRLTSLETALARVELRLGIPQSGTNWVEQIAGSLADLPEDDYQEFLRCCQAARQAVASEEMAT